MRAIWIGVLCAALAACSSTPTQEQSPAGVETRTGTEGGAATKGVSGSSVSGVDLTGMAALKDPNSILSKRAVFYDYDKYDVNDEYKPLVEAHAKFLRANPGARMLIQGNTDERGSREYNIALGQRRADGVKKMLILLGGKEDQIESVSLGEEKPRVQGSTEQAYSQNRRSDMLYKGEY